MNALRNRVLLIGRLGQDPERVEFDGDKVKASLRLEGAGANRLYPRGVVDSKSFHQNVLCGL